MPLPITRVSTTSGYVTVLTASKFIMVCPVSRYTESRKRTLVNVVGYTEIRKRWLVIAT